MKISCPACAAKYSIADDKVQDRLAKIRCRKCGTTIVIDGKVNPPSVQAGGAGGADEGPGSDEYSVDLGDAGTRNMTLGEIVAAYNNGELGADTYVWAEGMADWSPLADVPEINDALHAAHRAASQPPPAAEVPRAAARTGAGRGSAADLFGGIDSAGSEADVTTSAPDPAPVGGGGGGGTGARNESSVLFSLSALTAGTDGGNASASSSGTTASGDDSGLIDLKALTSSAEASVSSGPDLGLGGGLSVGAAPLGMAAPLGGMTANAAPADQPDAQKKSKVGLIAAAAAAVLIAGGGLFAFKSSTDADAAAAEKESAAKLAEAHASAAEAEARIAEAEAKAKEAEAAAAKAKEETAAKPPATGAEEEESPPAAKAVTNVASTRRAGPAPKASPSPSPSPAPKSSPASSDSSSSKKKKKKKKKKSCNCAPSDLMCAMKCASK